MYYAVKLDAATENSISKQKGARSEYCLGFGLLRRRIGNRGCLLLAFGRDNVGRGGRHDGQRFARRREVTQRQD